MLGDTVAAAVNVHVQADVEEMLMSRAAEIVVNHSALAIGLARRDGRGLDNAGQLCLKLNVPS